MVIQIRRADTYEVPIVAALVMELTAEISLKSDGTKFQQDLVLTTGLCVDWMRDNRYRVLLAYVGDEPVGVVTIAETYALYAGGQIGIIQECFVAASYRGRGVGRELIQAALAIGAELGWPCVELCTPPLPEFKQTIDFYQQHGFVPVGGRKMRRQFRPV